MILKKLKKRPLLLITNKRRTSKINMKINNKNKISPVKYHFIIGSSKFLLKNEPLEEMLRERAQFLRREKKPITFWLIKSPKFLNSPQLNHIQNKLIDAGLSEVELTAIVSLDESFTTWLKLRLQNVGGGNFMTGEDIFSPLASNLSREKL